MSIFWSKVIAKINTFLIHDLHNLSISLSFLVVPLFFILCSGLESEQCICLNRSFGCSGGIHFVFNIQVSSQLIFGSEGYITSCLADLVGTDVMCLREVCLKVGILSVVDVLVMISAQMACQVLPVYVVDEGQVIEQELLAEVTVWMRHDLAVPFVADVTVFDVATELLDVIQSLLTHENGPAFEANLAEGSVVRTFQMPL